MKNEINIKPDEYPTDDLNEMAIIAALTDRLPDEWVVLGRKGRLIGIYKGITGLPLDGKFEVVYTPNEGAEQRIPLLHGHDNYKYFESLMKRVIKEKLKKIGEQNGKRIRSESTDKKSKSKSEN